MHNTMEEDSFIYMLAYKAECYVKKNAKCSHAYITNLVLLM